MVELVDVFIGASRFPSGDSVELRVAGHSFSKPFSTTNEFGEARLVFEVPEWTGAAEATVRIGRILGLRDRSSRRKSGPLHSYRTSISMLVSRITLPKSPSFTPNRSTRRWA